MTALPIAIASRMVVMPAWKSVSSSGTTTKAASAYSWRRANRSYPLAVTFGGTSRPAELSVYFDHGLTAAIATSASSPRTAAAKVG